MIVVAIEKVGEIIYEWLINSYISFVFFVIIFFCLVFFVKLIIFDSVKYVKEVLGMIRE